MTKRFISGNPRDEIQSLIIVHDPLVAVCYDTNGSKQSRRDPMILEKDSYSKIIQTNALCIAGIRKPHGHMCISYCNT